MHPKAAMFTISTTTMWAALLAIVGLYFGFPNEIMHMPLMVLGYPLALYHLAMHDGSSQEQHPASSKKSSASVFRAAWLISIIAVSICLYWVAIPVHNVGALPWFLAVPCALAISAYIALFGAIFAVIVHATKDIFPTTQRALMFRGIFAGLVWCLLEYARNIILTGFPWLSLSAAFVPWPVVTQGASLVGAYGLSGLLVMVVALYYEAFVHRKEEKIRLSTGRLAANLVTALIVFGIYQLYFVEHNEDATPLHGAFIQGNIDQNQKWSKGYQDATVRHYMSLSHEAITPPATNEDSFIKPSLLIWPETSMPFYLQDEKLYAESFMAFAQEHNVALLIGTLGYARPPQNAAQSATKNAKAYDIYNRAYLFTPQSLAQLHESTPMQRHAITANTAYYDKEHLVPFGEYVPSWLKVSFLEDLMQGVGAFTAGGSGHAYNDAVVTSPKPIIWQNLALGMLICYESIFPELAQDRVASGATVLINISNDAWFGDTSAPEQHLHLSAMRAIEQGRYLVRGTNTGISAVVDDMGRIVVQGPLFRATSMAFTAKERTGFTVYHHIAPYLPWLVLLIAVILFAFYTLSKKRRNAINT
ncbi:MAG: apolipoprotein N-acyltransferase [Pseudomonadota bacterium]